MKEQNVILENDGQIISRINIINLEKCREKDRPELNLNLNLPPKSKYTVQSFLFWFRFRKMRRDFAINWIKPNVPDRIHGIKFYNKSKYFDMYNQNKSITIQLFYNLEISYFKYRSEDKARYGLEIDVNI